MAYHVPSTIAAHPGLCPLCNRHIAPGRSTISPIVPALPPDPDGLIYSHRSGGWQNYRGDVVHVRPRGWGHTRCVDRDWADLSLHDRQVLVDERRAELQRIKRECDRAWKQEHARQHPSRTVLRRRRGVA